MRTKIDIHFIGERVASGAADNLVFNVYRRGPNADDFEELAARMESTAAATKRRVAVLTYPLGPVQLPDAETRAAAVRLRRAQDANVAAAATVLDAGGFWSAAAISVINTVALLSKGSTETKAFRNRTDAIAWLAPHCVVSTPSEIEKGLFSMLEAVHGAK